METLRSAMPHIVHLAHTTESGGAEMALKRLLEAERDWHPGLLLPTVDSDDVFAEVSAPRWKRGVRQKSGGSRRSRVFDVGARLLVQAALTRWHHAVRRSDLVVANSTRSAAYGALAVAGTTRPFAVHLRDQVTVESLGSFGYRLMTQVVLPRADGVVANSQTTLDTAVSFLRDDAVRAVIPSPAGLDRLNLPPQGHPRLRIGMLARLDPWKGQLALLDAFAQAFPDGEAELELAGAALFEHEAFADELRARAEELGISDRVTLLGHVDDIAPLLAEWDIAVQYSLRPEPMGQNVLQCLAAGTALVVADEGGPTEWVREGENGLRVAPRDPQALAAALRRLASDTSLRSRLAHAAVDTPGLLGDADIAQLHAEAYREVIGVRRPESAKARVRSIAPRRPAAVPAVAAFQAGAVPSLTTATS